MFCAVLSMESVYNLVIIFSKYFHLEDVMPPAITRAFANMPQPPEDVVNITFFTLTSIFSSLAIMALFSIEHVFHEDLASVDFVVDMPRLKKLKFLSNLKFWGVKLFVTIEFTLECIMYLIKRYSAWEEIDMQLMYTTCMASMCFLIAVLHIFAYDPKGRWIVSQETLNDNLDNLGNSAGSEARNRSRSVSEETGMSLQALESPLEAPTLKALEDGLCSSDSLGGSEHSTQDSVGGTSSAVVASSS